MEQRKVEMVSVHECSPPTLHRIHWQANSITDLARRSLLTSAAGPKQFANDFVKYRALLTPFFWQTLPEESEGTPVAMSLITTQTLHATSDFLVDRHPFQDTPENFTSVVNPHEVRQAFGRRCVQPKGAATQDCTEPISALLPNAQRCAQAG